MNFISYAQNFEDVMLWRALRDVTPGTYIDIGAQDPVVDSVSRAFYEAGWRGIHVEPTPHYAAALRKDRPDEIVVEALIGAETGLKTFYEIPSTGLSTGMASVAEHHAAAGLTTVPKTARMISLASLLDELNGREVHWLKIDVEGMEPDVLRSWGKHPARPWVLVIESTYPNSQEPTHYDWIDEVRGRGYQEVYFDGLSRYFLTEGQQHRSKAFGAPPNIFDQYQIERHHFSSALLRQKMQTALDTARAEHDAQIAAMELSREAFEQEHQVALALRDNAIAISRQQLSKMAMALDQRDEELVATRLELASVCQFANSMASLLSELQTSRGWRWTEALRKAIEPQRSKNLSKRLESARQFGSFSAKHLNVGKALENTCKADSRPPMNVIQTTRHPFDLGELLSLDDHSFVRTAYRIALRRAPDPEGEAYYLGQLNHGSTKIEVLRQLRRSSEGQTMVPMIENLDQNLGLETKITYLIKSLRSRRKHTAPLHQFHINLLMRYHDEEFVRNAYKAILGREPDPAGLNHYLKQVRCGISRKEIVHKLHKSKEAKESNIKISGLKRFAVTNRIINMPVIGSVFTWIIVIFNIKLYLRNVRALQNHLYRISSNKI